MGFFDRLRPSHLGLMFVHMWVYCVTHRPVLAEDVSVMGVMYVSLSAFLLILIARFGRGPVSDRIARIMDAAAVICMVASAALLSLPLQGASSAAVFSGALLGGPGAAWAYLRWGKFYSTLDLGYSAPLIFVSMAVGSAGKLLIDFAPVPIAAVVLTALPFLVFGSLSKVGSGSASDEVPFVYFNRRTVGSLLPLFFGVALYSFTVGIVQSVLLADIPIGLRSSILLNHGSEVLLAGGLCAWVLRGGRLDVGHSWNLVLILMTTGLVFSPYLDVLALNHVLALVRTAQTFLIVILFLMLADIARHSSFDPLAVFAVGWVSYALPFAAGSIFGQELRAFSDAVLVASLAVWAIVIVKILFLDKTGSGGSLVFSDLETVFDGDSPAQRIGAMQSDLDRQVALSDRSPEGDSLKRRCAALARRFKLTARETEILELLARGRSKGYIADTFIISENTVRSHVKHVYTKLSVHSKQEMLDLIESADGQ